MSYVDPSFVRQMSGLRLTTAEVTYHLPDHPSVLQTFLWQTEDRAPRYPRLAKFLDFWRTDICAVIHSVRIAHNGVIAPAHWRGAALELQLH